MQDILVMIELRWEDYMTFEYPHSVMRSNVVNGVIIFFSKTGGY